MTTTTAAPAAGTDPRSFRSFAEFYPFYLGEHRNRTCRRLHFAGSTLALVCLVLLIVTGRPQYLLYGLLCGYGFAWLGHFAFERFLDDQLRGELHLAERDGQRQISRGRSVAVDERRGDCHWRRTAFLRKRIARGEQRHGHAESLNGQSVDPSHCLP